VRPVPLLAPLLSLLLAGAAPPAVEIREWPVPWENTRPRDPFADGRGRIWFVGQQRDDVAYLEPQSGRFRRYEIEAGTHPHNVIVDARSVWYAGNHNARIGLLDPDTGAVRAFPMPDPAAADPHTLVFDGSGDIWFTVQGGGFIGKLLTRTGEVKLVRPDTPNSRPYGIKVDRSGRPWVNLFNTNRIASVDPATLEVREHELPRPDARTRRIEITSDQRIWYVDYSGGYLGRLDPRTGEVKEWPAPGGAHSGPYALARDHRDRLWFVETGVQPNRFVGFDPATEQVFSQTPIPSGGGAVRHMMFEPTRREIWFGTDRNTIGKLVLPR
jgi:virginiamycin B lyase